jgi:hypothetical protein
MESGAEHDIVRHGERSEAIHVAAMPGRRRGGGSRRGNAHAGLPRGGMDRVASLAMTERVARGWGRSS